MLSSFTTHVDQEHKNLLKCTKSEFDDMKEIDKPIANRVNKEESSSNILIDSINYSSNLLKFICDLNANEMDTCTDFKTNTMANALQIRWKTSFIRNCVDFG